MEKQMETRRGKRKKKMEKLTVLMKNLIRSPLYARQRQLHLVGYSGGQSAAWRLGIRRVFLTSMWPNYAQSSAATTTITTTTATVATSKNHNRARRQTTFVSLGCEAQKRMSVTQNTRARLPTLPLTYNSEFQFQCAWQRRVHLANQIRENSRVLCTVAWVPSKYLWDTNQQRRRQWWWRQSEPNKWVNVPAKFAGHCVPASQPARLLARLCPNKWPQLNKWMHSNSQSGVAPRISLSGSPSRSTGVGVRSGRAGECVRFDTLTDPMII